MLKIYVNYSYFINIQARSYIYQDKEFSYFFNFFNIYYLLIWFFIKISLIN